MPRKPSPILEDALALMRQLGEPSWEADLLGQLGLAAAAAGQRERGLAILEQELSGARAAADRPAEKRSLAHLGLTHSRLHHPGKQRCQERMALFCDSNFSKPYHHLCLCRYRVVGPC